MRGATKQQLALAVAKARRDELVKLNKFELLEAKGIAYVLARIEQLNLDIKQIEGTLVDARTN